MRHGLGASTSLTDRRCVIGGVDEVASPVLAADDSLGRELHQDQPDSRPACAKLPGELPLGWQAPAWPKLASRDEIPDRALHALRLRAHTAPRHPAALIRASLRVMSQPRGDPQASGAA